MIHCGPSDDCFFPILVISKVWITEPAAKDPQQFLIFIINSILKDFLTYLLRCRTVSRKNYLTQGANHFQGYHDKLPFLTCILFSPFEIVKDRVGFLSRITPSKIGWFLHTAITIARSKLEHEFGTLSDKMGRIRNLVSCHTMLVMIFEVSILF